MSTDEAIRQYAIYDHPTDYPLGFVVREWIIAGAQVTAGTASTAATLEEARKLVPKGSVCLGRTPEDDEKIAEVWVA